MFVITPVDTNSQMIESVLDDTLYYIILNWNETNKNWTIGLRNSSYRVILDGVSAVPNYPLLWRFRYQDMPKGELMVVSSSWRNGPIPRSVSEGFTTGNYALIYITEEDLEDDNLIGIWERL
jgi:Domain of unknown function (DUF6983)